MVNVGDDAIVSGRDLIAAQVSLRSKEFFRIVKPQRKLCQIEPRKSHQTDSRDLQV